MAKSTGRKLSKCSICGNRAYNTVCHRCREISIYWAGHTCQNISAVAALEFGADNIIKYLFKRCNKAMQDDIFDALLVTKTL